MGWNWKGWEFYFYFFFVLLSDGCFRVSEIAGGFWGFVRFRYCEALVYRGVSIKGEWFSGHGSGLGLGRGIGRAAEWKTEYGAGAGCGTGGLMDDRSNMPINQGIARL